MTGQGLSLGVDDPLPLAAVGGRAWSRAEVRQLSQDLSERLQQAKVGRVLVRSDDPVHILRAIDACHRLGADLFIAHTTLPQAEVDEVMERHSVQALVGEVDRIVDDPVPNASGSGRIFMMTSGTTGRPKIASHTLDSLLSRVRAGARLPSNRGGKWLLTYQPTGFAGVQVMLTALEAGGMVIAPTQRTPGGFYEAARHWEVSQISATPTFWRAFLMVADPAALALRQITMGGEAADQVTLDRVRRAFPAARITHTYASTEAGVVYAVHDGREGFPSAWLEKPVQGAQLRLRDGFLQIKTPNAMGGYLSERSQPLLDDGWLATADRCEIVGDRVLVLGRDDSSINVAGSKVYPLAIETFLLALPGVMEARVYGAASPISGALVCADVVLAAGEDPKEGRRRLMSACRAGLSRYQAPSVLKIVDAIEVKASGKKG